MYVIKSDLPPVLLFSQKQPVDQINNWLIFDYPPKCTCIQKENTLFLWCCTALHWHIEFDWGMPLLIGYDICSEDCWGSHHLIYDNCWFLELYFTLLSEGISLACDESCPEHYRWNKREIHWLDKKSIIQIFQSIFYFMAQENLTEKMARLNQSSIIWWRLFWEILSVSDHKLICIQITLCAWLAGNEHNQFLRNESVCDRALVCIQIVLLSMLSPPYWCWLRVIIC